MHLYHNSFYPIKLTCADINRSVTPLFQMYVVQIHTITDQINSENFIHRLSTLVVNMSLKMDDTKCMCFWIEIVK